ncbi:MAG: SurA N-terminal domain-containing protein [Bacteroidales bacterium]|nr:SurA N-terminal domain-containing protein [Bacteroidales bacterium]MBP6453527.1 SurA N-terminal domain-containing protein [Bacteroidales bacterium]MBP8677038.1 SurA N-terminal domain-containing protein [Bacteroidales bacterium]MBP9583640.1 SurA N-terminal domain-containing protein [Bacteroidales bacterium]MBP9977649.1 SurA N-terminal domain-containing protein [Bacteroidales bacterium]
MAVLEKIRVRMGVFITVIIGIALLSFIVDAQTLQSAISMFTSKYDVGEMNGKAISYQEFQKKIDYFTQIQQMVTGQASLDEQGQEMVNESAWQDLMGEYVLIPSIENAGIGVGEEELLDLTQGTSISPVLMREQSFMGQDGSFDRNKLVEFVKAIPQDESGNLATYWSFLEKSIKNDQMFTKYISLLDKSTITSPVEMKRVIAENNTTSDVSFVMQPFGFMPDTTVTVSQQEIKDYYNKNKAKFDMKASRDIDYVVFEVIPSAEDIKLAKEDIEKVYEEFTTTTNLKSFLARNSEKQLSDYLFKQGELASISPALDSFAFSAPLTAVLPVFQEGNTFRAARINAIKSVADSVFVEHILLDNSAPEVAMAKADSLIKLIDGGADFQTLAAENSLDKNPNVAPGELGWMTQLMKLPGLDTCFTAPLNKPLKVATSYGLHIVKASKRTAPVKKVQIALLEKSAVASKQTFQDYYSKANELASKADGKMEQFQAAVKEMNLSVVPAVGIEEGAKTVATYNNARPISRWIYEAKKNDVSQIISIDNKYFFVVAVTGVREAGIQPFDAIKDNIKTVLQMEKTNEKFFQSVKEKLAGTNSIETVAEILGTTVSKQSGISFGAMGAQSMDPVFIGAATSAPENKLTGPVKGNLGIYLFNVDARTQGEFFTEQDAKMRSGQMFSYKLQQLQSIFEKTGKVKDNRLKFF